MPELPEVETVARSIAPVVGRRIMSADIRPSRVLRGASPVAVQSALTGRRIMSVERRGKFILIALEECGYLLVHLGMTGRLLLNGIPGKHTHAILRLDEGSLIFDDSRQFGAFEWCAAVPTRVERLGPEPLEVSLGDFRAALRRRKTRMKALLLDQGFLRGIGNIYADESLHRAGIHPLASAARLRPERAARLYESIREVLSEAIAAGGSSISDYVDAQGRKGFFQVNHRVYQRAGEACLACGAEIRRILVAQRSSHYCPKCQKR